ncbi:MAG: hypothetical protein KF846_04725 [Cyclobacteriaceae bacterium]|nr:hypothetical protein [Cyclobacteriaceae bacterium]
MKAKQTTKHSLPSIAKEHGLTVYQLRNLLKKQGIKLNGKRLTVDQYRELKEGVLHPIYRQSRKSLAGLYNVSDETFRKWLKVLRISSRKSLSPGDINLIYKNHGLPETYQNMFPDEIADWHQEYMKLMRKMPIPYQSAINHEVNSPVISFPSGQVIDLNK